MLRETVAKSCVDDSHSGLGRSFEHESLGEDGVRMGSDCSQKLLKLYCRLPPMSFLSLLIVDMHVSSADTADTHR